MIIPSAFKCCVAESYIPFFTLVGVHCSLVHDAAGEAVSSQGTVWWVSAVAGFVSRLFGFVDDSLIVGVNYLFHVIHAAITNLDKFYY